MTLIWLSLGANLGDRQANIELAIERLSERVVICRRSEVIETAPLSAEGPDYLNCVAEGRTELSPRDLLVFTQEIESAMGRSGKGSNAPRPIDVDILFYGDTVLHTPDLVIPHPRLHERSFVLDPLCSLEPGLRHPVLKREIRDLAHALGRLGPAGASPGSGTAQAPLTEAPEG